MGSHIIPFEGELRARLLRQGVPEAEVGDVVQDAYLAIARLDSVAHITNARAYFFVTARNALFQRLRRQRIVRIDSMTEAHSFVIADENPSPERQVSARMELARVRSLIDALPDRCREIFELRRLHGVPQREIAERMGVSEKVVEAQAIRGLKLILKAIERDGTSMADDQKPPARHRQSNDLNRK